MTDADKCYRMFVFSKNEIMVSGEIRAILIKDIWILHDNFRLRCNRRTPLIERDNLLVEMIDRRSSRTQPILKNTNVPRIPVHVENIYPWIL